ncbi:hypothetical protein [Polluticaenibacter yanchengensis]|uniref:Uncharacterized protein n=1 Tax=Polluticaenibacter yanchengensis TaxID=3014562 RepID=A0ABT4UKL3_9BACT|nr:hypothetical protein [Chitinophagaceae bacterium LY-5]
MLRNQMGKFMYKLYMWALYGLYMGFKWASTGRQQGCIRELVLKFLKGKQSAILIGYCYGVCNE